MTWYNFSNSMVDPTYIELFEKYEIKITATTHSAYKGFFKNQPVAIRIGRTPDKDVNNEATFLQTSKKRGINFLPEKVLFVKDSGCEMLVKEFMPGNNLYELYEQSISVDYEECEKQVSKQIVELYNKGLCHADLHLTNILFNDANNQFILCDYGSAQIESFSNLKSALNLKKFSLRHTAQASVDLHELLVLCNIRIDGKELYGYISDKLKIPVADAKQSLYNGANWNLYNWIW